MCCSDWRRHTQHVGVGEGPLEGEEEEEEEESRRRKEEEEEEEEESLFKADAVNEEDSERDRATGGASFIDCP